MRATRKRPPAGRRSARHLLCDFSDLLWLPRSKVSAAFSTARTFVGSLTSDAAKRKTFELVLTKGPEQKNFDEVFAPLGADPEDALDAVYDMANMPLEDEPKRVREDLDAERTHHLA